jgi:mRNA interferase RelE/StbE
VAFEIVWSESAFKQLRKLERPIAKRIVDSVSRLTDNPERFVSKIVNSPYHRLRVGDYRIILDIRKNELRVLILKVGHRKSIC